MTFSTYLGLQTAVADWGTFTQTAQVPTFVGWAHQEICRRLRCNTMLASATLTLSAETISQPTGFLAFKRVYLDTTSPRRKLETISAESAMDMSASLVSQTYPTHVAVEGALLRFAPLFTSTTTTASALYYKAPTTLSADGDTNTVLTQYPFAYLWGSLEALYRFMEDDNEADRWGQMFGALIEDINSREARDVMSGPLQVQNYAGAVI